MCSIFYLFHNKIFVPQKTFTPRGTWKLCPRITTDGSSSLNLFREERLLFSFVIVRLIEVACHGSPELATGPWCTARARHHHGLGLCMHLNNLNHNSPPFIYFTFYSYFVCSSTVFFSIYIFLWGQWFPESQLKIHVGCIICTHSYLFLFVCIKSCQRSSYQVDEIRSSL